MSESAGYAPGRARRRQIIDAAITCFGRSGFDGASIQDIASACGISRQGVLHHFESKEALLLAVLEQRNIEDYELFTGVLSRTHSPISALVAVVRANAAQPEVIALFTRLSAEASQPGHPAHDHFARLYDRLRSDLRDAIAAAQHEGQIGSELPAEHVADIFIAMKDGLVLQRLFRPESSEDDSAAAILDETASLFAASGHKPPGCSVIQVRALRQSGAE